MLCERITQALEDIDKIRNELLSIAEEAKGQENIQVELQKLADRFSGKSSVTKPSPKKPNVVSKYLEVVESPDLIQPGLGETFHKFLDRVRKSYNHTTALQISKHMKGEIRTDRVQATLDGGLPNRGTREVWSRYLALSEGAVDCLIDESKAQSEN